MARLPAHNQSHEQPSVTWIQQLRWFSHPYAFAAKAPS